MNVSRANFEVQASEEGRQTLVVSGDWTIWTLADVEPALRAHRLAPDSGLDVSGLGRLDTSGAYVLTQAVGGRQHDGDLALIGDHPTARRLIEQVRTTEVEFPADPPHEPGIISLLNRAGHGAVDAWKELTGTLSFIGETMAAMARLVVSPGKIRWTSIVSVMEDVGLDALPIVCFLSFFIGLVIAFIGANLLAMFNASVFVVELVGIGVLREFGAVLTAILLAGRTDSAFTAQIGSMKMRQEIDAMRVIGLDPMNAIVAPRLIALLIMTPLLTFAATIAGVAGGLVAAWTAMDISPTLFIERFQLVVPAQHFWVGIVKAPVFAVVIALVGCRQGLLVEGDVTSLGRRTTSSVVQSIFLVIAIDAMFAIIFYLMDV